MWVVFDVLIFGFLLTAALFMLQSGRSYKTVVVGVCWIVIFYGSFIEPRIIVVNEQFVDLQTQEESGEQISVVVLSDIHAGVYKKSHFVERIVEMVNAQQPDLVLIAGDFILDSKKDVHWLEPLSELEAQLGVYAVLGNHDYHHQAESFVLDGLDAYGLTVLVDEQMRVKVREQEVVLVGLNDWWNAPDLDVALEGVVESDTVILLEHNPDVLLDDRSRMADLVVAGHTHGGQIRLPFLGPVPSIPTELGQKFDQGLFLFDQTQLFITSGVGESGPRARLFNPPEIVVLTLQL